MTVVHVVWQMVTPLDLYNILHPPEVLVQNLIQCCVLPGHISLLQRRGPTDLYNP
jgi:hypothetical protein